MSKVLYLSLVGASLLLGTATNAVADSTSDMAATVKNLQAQIEALSAKLQKLDAKQKEANTGMKRSGHAKPCAHHKRKDEMLQTVANQAEAYLDKKLAEKEKQTPKGYIHIAGSNTAIKIGGYVKLDAIYDAGPFTGDTTALPALPLERYSPEAQRTGYFRMHGRESRLSVATLTSTKGMGDITSYIEGDFLGTNNFGTAAISRAEPASVSSYNFRLRLAYVDFIGFRAGQEWTTVLDRDARGSSLEFNGITGNNLVRNAQIRYTMQNIMPNTSWAVALENPYTDYTDNTGALRGDNAFLGGSVGDGFQQLPDLTTQLKARGNAGHIAVSAMARRLTIKSFASSGGVIRKSANGWGVGLSGKLKTTYRGGIWARSFYGYGVGRYIFDLVGQSAAFDPTNRRFQAQKGWGVGIGVEHYWTEEWRSNLAYGHSGVSLARFAPRNVGSTTVPITRGIDQFTINTFYTPLSLSNLEIGLEFDYYLRRATGRYKGTGKRFQLGIKYTI